MNLAETFAHERIDDVIAIAQQAGDIILEYYHSDFSVDYKADNTPLTQADTAANDAIVSALSKFAPSIPVVSEESQLVRYSERSKWRNFWLIDPMDGTKSFVRKDDQFTVNIALIEDNAPILGVVHIPCENVTYWAVKGSGAFRVARDHGKIQSIHVRKLHDNRATIMHSAYRSVEKVYQFAHNLKSQSIDCDYIVSSSSIKFCRVAEGIADVYPAFGKTSEWDTAAAQCVVECAGGKVQDLEGRPLVYNKTNTLNPAFMAFGSDCIVWRQFIPDNAQTWTI